MATPYPRYSRGRVRSFFRQSIHDRDCRALTAGFSSAGYAAKLYDERAIYTSKSSRHGVPEGAARVIVAPHEFFAVESEGRAVPVKWGAGAIVLNVEQLHTHWFRAGLEALHNASCILDISLQSAAALASMGLPAVFLPLGYVPDFAPFKQASKLADLAALSVLEPSIKDTCPLPSASLLERPIDIFFIGNLSPRRAGILERMAGRLARWRCHFVLTDAAAPKVRGKNAVLGTEATIGLAQRSKIVLNLHQDDEPFFEWHRIVLQGIWQRALVVSEPVAMQSRFAAGEHFLEAPLDELAGLIDWVLGSEQGMQTAERVRNQAYRQLTRFVRLDKTLLTLFTPGAETGERGAGAGHVRLKLPAPGAPGIAPAPETPSHIVYRHDSGRPAEATIVVPVLNGVPFLAKCCESIRRQEGVAIEAIIVDDGSWDGSSQVARDLLLRDEATLTRALVIRHEYCAGPSAARDTGMRASTTPAALLLDVDNIIYPRCVKRCLEALDASGAAFVYPMLAILGSRGGLLGSSPFDKAKLAKGNYIDTLALVRRSAWQAAGGFPSLNEGLEDYAFWLTLIEHGFWGAQVPEILGAYVAHRAGRTGMLATQDTAVSTIEMAFPWVKIA